MVNLIDCLVVIELIVLEKIYCKNITQQGGIKNSFSIIRSLMPILKSIFINIYNTFKRII